ncbi:MAG TPA: alpha-L-rhamnosidase N-terminal domain-containing protein, partial [Actinoplanes sp.]|nr:alpha-L-rhamnosidase N-terminal domain-containing protein [Actinoplanes sp.]
MQGRMITPVSELGSAPVLRKEFSLEPSFVRATLRISSLGVHEARINGIPVGEDVLSPGWSSYEHRLRYVTHDVTESLATDNVLTVLIGNGWYRGRLGFMGGRAFYGDRLGLIAELEIEYADGSSRLIVTDETWTADNSDVIADDLYHGQTIDARQRTELRTWRLAVRPLDFDKSLLTPYIGPVVTRH